MKLDQTLKFVCATNETSLGFIKNIHRLAENHTVPYLRDEVNR